MGTTTEELRSELAARREDIGRDIETIEDRVSPGRIVHRKQTALRAKVQGARDKVMGVRDAADGALHDVTGSVTQTVRSTGSGAHDAAQGSPLIAGLVAFGVGVVASALLPPTRAEKAAATRAQQPLEAAAAELAAVGQDAVEELRPVASQAVTDLTEHAQDSAKTVAHGAQDLRSNRPN